MISGSTVWAIARAEARLARRLVRYWVFLALATLLAAGSYVQFVFIHRLFSAGSASAALANPRFFAGNFGANFVLMFLLGIVFLGFDLRARDQRERIVEVLDATPCTNVELVFGRGLGLLVAAWLPIVAVAVVLALVTFLVGPPIHLPSLVGLVAFMALPAYVFAIGLVFLVALLVRLRLVAALVSIGLIALFFFVSLWWIPLWVTPLTDVSGGYSFSFPSDLVGTLFTWSGLLQRLGYMALGVGMLLAAAAIHPRLDDGSRARRGAAAAAVAALGIALCGWLALDNRAAVKARASWSAAHEARKGEAVPDLLALGGTVDIAPGQSIAADLTLRLRAPAERPLGRALWTLNPGLRVSEVRSGDGSALDFTHADGLLDVGLGRPLAPGEETSLRVVFAGRPEPRFAYLDAAIEPLEIEPAKAQIIVLGFEPIEFRRGYVALLPGVRWLPASGPEYGRGDPKVHPEDFYDLDLVVELPAGWLAAGPGRRREAPGAPSGRVRFRFAPPAPVPEVALVAGRFTSHATDVGDVRLELLLDDDHGASVEFFADAAGEVHKWLAERLRQAADVGFAYPYDALTMVEVPNELRGFGGGWRMDSTLIQPALILTKESGFPTADFRAARERLEREAEEQGGLAVAKRRQLETFFENDMNGGNPFIAAARSFFGYQTSGRGAEALALDHVWEHLTSELVSERTGFFSVHFFDQDFGQEFVLAGQAMNDPNRVSDRYAEVLIHRVTSTNKVWDTVTGVRLRDLEPREDPERALSALSLKGNAMAEAMLDSLGREKTGRLLGTLRASRRGANYSRDDVVAAGLAVGEDLASWLELWIDATDLPGFTLGDVRYFRLPDADGSPRYQLRIVVRNGEAPAGLVRLEYRLENQRAGAGRQRGEPVRIPGRTAVEIGLVTSEPLGSVRVVPYLALNRDPFNVTLPTLDAQRVVAEEPLVGGRPFDWSGADAGAIVVDDLDPGFSVEDSRARGMLRVAGRGGEVDLDQGLPLAPPGFRGLRTRHWSRLVYADAWGRYRHTAAVVRAGEGERSATFRAALPEAGAWELDYYVPGWRARGGRAEAKRGSWRLVVEDAAGRHEVRLDADAASAGWISVGRFDLAAGEVRVRVDDATEGEYVQADAIRWRPAGRAAAS